MPECYGNFECHGYYCYCECEFCNECEYETLYNMI